MGKLSLAEQVGCRSIFSPTIGTLRQYILNSNLLSKNAVAMPLTFALYFFGIRLNDSHPTRLGQLFNYFKHQNNIMFYFLLKAFKMSDICPMEDHTLKSKYNSWNSTIKKKVNEHNFTYSKIPQCIYQTNTRVRGAPFT